MNFVQKLTLEVLAFLSLLCGVVLGADTSLEQSLLAEDASALAAAAKKEGDPLRGAALFFQSKLSCAICHSVADRTGSIGPDLTLMDKKLPDIEMIEAILLPSKKIVPAYTTISGQADHADPRPDSQARHRSHVVDAVRIGQSAG